MAPPGFAPPAPLARPCLVPPAPRARPFRGPPRRAARVRLARACIPVHPREVAGQRFLSLTREGAVVDARPWFRSIFTLRGRAFPVKQVLSCAVAAAVCCAAPLRLTLPSLPHSLCGGPLGFLLVFRLNQAYARWRHAHTLMVAMRSTCLDISTMVGTWVDARRAVLAIRLLQAFVQAVWESVNGKTTCANWGSVQAENPALHAELMRIEPRVRPVFIAYSLRICLAGNRNRDAVASNLDTKVARLLGIHEELLLLQDLGTVNPLSYSIHLRSLLMLFLWSLPLVLLGVFQGIFLSSPLQLGLCVVVVETLIAFAFCGIDSAASEADAPMGSAENDVDGSRYVTRTCSDLDGAIANLQVFSTGLVLPETKLDHSKV